jgi:ankyrin repeat protein
MEKNENNNNLNNYEEEEDDFAKSLEKDLEESTKLYINNITTNSPYKSDTELLLLSKEEIITYKNLIITSLNTKIQQLTKENEMLLTNYKQTTDALLSKLKDNYSNKGIRPETPSLIKNVFNNNNKISNKNNYQICNNCNKKILEDNYFEHSLLCLRKIFKCSVCENIMPFEEKNNHFLYFYNKKNIINWINTKNTKFFNLVLLHNFDVNNEIIDEEKKNYLIHFLVNNNAINLLEILLSYKNINLELRNKNDYTPLMLSCKLNYEQISLLLLNKGADVNAKNILGDSPLRFCQLNKNEKLSFILINKYKCKISNSKF